jgi:hypothetical protein
VADHFLTLDKPVDVSIILYDKWLQYNKAKNDNMTFLIFHKFNFDSLGKI